MFRLDAEVDASKVQAEYDNGILTIHLPKSKETMAKQIPIKTKK
ncbi:MAG: Hsp20/alpha crystallin family protein [Calditrichota bacterium]